MATYIPLYNLPVQYMDNSGDPLTSGTLEFYDAGTTDTQQLFADDEGSSIGTSIALNSWGMPESGGATITLFRDQSKSLKVVLKNAAGATVSTSDNIPAVASFDATASVKLDGIEAGADVTDADNVAAAGALMTDGSASMSGDLTMGAATFVVKSVTAGITASTTQTQGQQLLTSELNIVSVVANTSDAVTLPEAAAGMPCIVANDGANTLQIFPSSGDTISGGAVDASVNATTTERITFYAYDATNWIAV